jgi:sugar lactone lactonase YvrE
MVENIFKEMKYQVQLIKDVGQELLEGPVYDKSENLLYFVSILEYRVYRYNPLIKELVYIQLTSPTSCVFLSPKYGIVAATTLGFYTLDFAKFTAKLLFSINIASSMRFNDGILDAKGRFLIGTMGYPEIINNAGSVFSYSEGNLKTLISDTTISNGIAFTKDSSKMYFIDTPTRSVKAYNYDLESGNCEYIEEIIHFKDEGVPDGMDIDELGNLWIAEWGGYCVSVWNPANGDNIGKIQIPSENVTSICFDGLCNLYVTTAKSYNEEYKQGGSLYYVKLEKDE